MKKLLLLALVALAGWYGWHHYPEIIHRQPAHEALIVNQTGRPLTRVRLVVDGQTFVRERIEDGAEATFDFRVAHDSDFQLIWEWGDSPGESQWRGGRVPHGPMVQKHTFTIDGDREVIYQAYPK